MSRIHISNNLGKVGNPLAGYKGDRRICRISRVEGSRGRFRSQDVCGYVSKNEVAQKVNIKELDLFSDKK